LAGEKQAYEKAISAGLNLAWEGEWEKALAEYEKALADFANAIKLDAEYADAYSGRGFTYLLMGKPDKAIADCSKAIELESTS